MGILRIQAGGFQVGNGYVARFGIAAGGASLEWVHKERMCFAGSCSKEVSPATIFIRPSRSRPVPMACPNQLTQRKLP